jgi:hypothetical protein
MRSENMDICLNDVDLNIETEEEYKIHVDNAIVNILLNEERLVFASVVEKAKITPFIISKHIGLRIYILERMKYHKEMYIIDKKINRAVISLLKSNRNITFLSIINKCKISMDTAYQDQIIKNKVKDAILQSKQIHIINNVQI